jgi:iron complex outermembrane receptor protein
MLVCGVAAAQTVSNQPAKAIQQGAPAKQQTAPAIPTVRTTVVVVGAPDPLTGEESARSTSTLELQPDRLAYSNSLDLLRDDASVDLEQRGGGGVQTDVTIRGGSFEQTLVLLNGLRINDVETSHFNLDLPVPTDALASVNVLHGAGSALYGSDAVSGVVDFVTAAAEPGLRLKLRAGAGSFGENEQAFIGSWGGAKASEMLAGGREFSNGFIADRDYRSGEMSSETRTHSRAGDSDVLLAGSDRAFGAAGFYGNYNSWERTKGWFASLAQQFNSKTQAAVAFRRHSDIFVLKRDDPSYYPENQHIDTSWEGDVRRRDDLPVHGAALFYGLETNADEIHSTSLGDHGRNRSAGYADFELTGHRWGTLSAGAREEIFSGGRAVFTPDVAASLWAHHSVKLRASGGRGFRLPTYTDLYYSDPVDIPNPNLKPESAWSFDGGADWYVSARIATSLTVFHSIQTDAIDYVRADASEPWQAENLSGLRGFCGLAPLKHATGAACLDDTIGSAEGVERVAVRVCLQLSSAERKRGVDRTVAERAAPKAASASCKPHRQERLSGVGCVSSVSGQPRAALCAGHESQQLRLSGNNWSPNAGPRVCSGCAGSDRQTVVSRRHWSQSLSKISWKS